MPSRPSAQHRPTSQRPALLRCKPLIPGLQPQTKARIIDAQIAVRAAQNRIGLHSRNFLRHDPNVDCVARHIPISIEIDAVVEFSDLGDVPLQADVRRDFPADDETRADTL
jgi:hypothetical protein